MRLVNTIIQQAVRNRASDIHLEPERKEVRIRCRIDGVLHETMRMPKYIQVPLTERFKPEDPTMQVELARGRGCEACRNTGYQGRIGIHELLCNNVWMAETIARNAAYADLKGAAKANGMHELREDGFVKILEGITTPDEIERLGSSVVR